ncbi:unnamed protein product [Caretta caretta]
MLSRVRGGHFGERCDVESVAGGRTVSSRRPRPRSAACKIQARCLEDMIPELLYFLQKVVSERRNIHKLLDEVFFSEKIYKLNEDMACSVAGITSDANVLTNELRLIAQRYLLQYQEPIPCEQLVTALCDIKQAYTQFGGKRPFGVSLLYIGWDKHYGFQLYQSDPSGNYGGWKATCIGNNSAAAVSMLKQDYKEGAMTLKSALALAIKVLNKTMDVSKLSAEKVEIATLTRENGKTTIRVLKQKEVEQLIKKHEEEEAKSEREKKEKEQKEKDK